MLQLTAFLFHGIYSLVAKKQLYASARADAATALLICFYSLASLDLLLVAEKILRRLALPGQGLLLLLLLLLLAGSLILEVRYFRRHSLTARLTEYQHEKGMRRLAYALSYILAFALVIAFPFSGIL